MGHEVLYTIHTKKQFVSQSTHNDEGNIIT